MTAARMSHHHKAPFVTAGLIIIVTVLTGVATFTNYWGVNTGQNVNTGIYPWGKSDANILFKRDPGWLQCVVVCQLMAFSFELLFCLLVIPAIIFRKLMPVHAACSVLSLIIFILLSISVIVYGVNVSNYNTLVVPLKLGWSWGISLAAAIMAFILLMVNATSTGYATYTEYR